MKCGSCKKTFTSTYHQKRYCSFNCRKEVARKRSKKWYYSHLKYVKIRDKKYAFLHVDKIKKYYKEWREKNRKKKQKYEPRISKNYKKFH